MFGLPNLTALSKELDTLNVPEPVITDLNELSDREVLELVFRKMERFENTINAMQASPMIRSLLPKV